MCDLVVYIEVLMDPPVSCLSGMSRKRSWPSFSFSMVNWMLESTLFRCWWSESTRLKGSAVQVSSTYLLQKCGGVCKVGRAFWCLHQHLGINCTEGPYSGSLHSQTKNVDLFYFVYWCVGCVCGSGRVGVR